MHAHACAHVCDTLEGNIAEWLRLYVWSLTNMSLNSSLVLCWLCHSATSTSQSYPLLHGAQRSVDSIAPSTDFIVILEEA